jgi:signal peptidase I
MRKKSALREWIESIIIAASLAIFVRTFFFQIYKIPTTSMVPTLKPGDKIFVSKLVYGPRVPFTPLRIKGFRKPKRGDIIVFLPPHERRKAYIKRLLGLPGERILIKGGNVYINGKLVTEPVIAKNFYYNQGKYGENDKEIVIPPGKYFVLGDNSMSSLDSRYWGFVDEKDIMGKAVFIWWPPNRIGVVD